MRRNIYDFMSDAFDCGRHSRSATTRFDGTTEKARTENAAPKCRGGKGEKMYI